MPNPPIYDAQGSEIRHGSRAILVSVPEEGHAADLYRDCVGKIVTVSGRVQDGRVFIDVRDLGLHRGQAAIDPKHLQVYAPTKEPDMIPAENLTLARGKAMDAETHILNAQVEATRDQGTAQQQAVYLQKAQQTLQGVLRALNTLQGTDTPTEPSQDLSGLVLASEIHYGNGQVLRAPKVKAPLSDHLREISQQISKAVKGTTADYYVHERLKEIADIAQTLEAIGVFVAEVTR